MLYALGQQYLRQLTAIHDDAQRVVNARRGEIMEPRSLESLMRGGSTRSADPQTRQVVQIGAVLRDRLIQEGFIERVENDRGEALQTHRQALATVLTDAKIAALELLVYTEVAPSTQRLETRPNDTPPSAQLAFPSSVTRD